MNNSHKILYTVKEKLREFLGDNLIEIILFGSQVKGKGNYDSDYDLLIIVKNTIDWRAKQVINSLCYQVDLQLDIITDIHILSLSELHSIRGKQAIFQDAINKGIHA